MELWTRAVFPAQLIKSLMDLDQKYGVEAVAQAAAWLAGWKNDPKDDKEGK